MDKRLQAKHVPDEALLAEIDRQNRERPHYAGAIWWEAAERLGLPGKIVLAKARALVKRGIVEGCCCGCRGDFRRRARPEGSER